MEYKDFEKLMLEHDEDDEISIKRNQLLTKTRRNDYNHLKLLYETLKISDKPEKEVIDIIYGWRDGYNVGVLLTASEFYRETSKNIPKLEEPQKTVSSGGLLSRLFSKEK